MPQKLIVLSGPDEGRTFPVGREPLLLGRSRATDGHLLDDHVSRVHCQIHPDGGQVVLADFDSAGGTFVNGKRITRHALQPGDIIRIGNTRLQFAVEPEPPASPDSAPAAAAPVRESLPIAVPIVFSQGSPWVQELAGQKISHYKVGSPMARSNSGFVFHARDTRRNLAVVLKVLDPLFSKDLAAVKQFVKVIKLVLPLRHPHLIKVFGAGKTGPYCWIAREYVIGESLAAVIANIETTGMLDWRHGLRVGIFLGQALDYVHQKKLIHHRVIPANILVGKTMKETKLTDLMMAAAIADDATKPISAAGVPSPELAFLPPECTDGPKSPDDPRVDIYALGATMYALFTGQPPLKANTVDELVKHIRLEAPASLKSFQLGLPEPLIHMNQKMLAKRPEDRYQSAKELVKHLEIAAKTHNVEV
jgi:hypothetical protein